MTALLWLGLSTFLFVVVVVFVIPFATFCHPFALFLGFVCIAVLVGLHVS